MLIVLAKPEIVSKQDANIPICLLTFILTFIIKNITNLSLCPLPKNLDSAVECPSIQQSEQLTTGQYSS